MDQNYYSSSQTETPSFTSGAMHETLAPLWMFDDGHTHVRNDVLS